MPDFDKTKQTGDFNRTGTMLEQKVKHLEDVVYSVTWDDLKAPASGINPAGQVAPPDVSNVDGSLLFSTNDAVCLWLQFPHDYVEGSNIRIHIHWTKTSNATGVVNWQTKYKWASIGELFPAFSSLKSGTLAVSDKDTDGIHALTEFGEISGIGKGISSMICIYLIRTATGDTYGAEAKLLEIDIHYQRNIYSSNEEYSKKVFS